MSDVHRTIDAVWKLESARIVGGLARLVHDVGLAEELAQDALVAALEQWPLAGVPDNPGAWLTTVARRRAVDHIRRSRTAPVGEPPVEPEQQEQDDVLRLIFVCCHPALPADARIALTLRLVAGLTNAEIARAFLLDEPRVTRRIAAAKQTLADEGAGFTQPDAASLAGRLASVLEVLYLVFNEGYAATAGDDLIRGDLCREALRLGRMLAELVPGEPEVHGLVALMELQASRSAARIGPDGELVLLHEQNRGRWDQLLIRRGFAAMLRARKTGKPPGPYVVQAAIAVCHAQATTAEDTDWQRIAKLYDTLVRLMPSPVVRLNRAVAVGMAYGPEFGLAEADALLTDPALRDYYLLPGVRGDLLARLGRPAEARREFERALTLTRNRPEQQFLHRRAADMAALLAAVPPPAPPPAPPAVSSPAVSSPAVASPAVASPAVASPAVSPPAVSPPAVSPSAGAAATASGLPDAGTSFAGVARSRNAGADVARAGAAVRVGAPGPADTLGAVAIAFLGRDDLDAATVRSYRQTVTRLRRGLGDSLPLGLLTAETVATVFTTTWGSAAPKTWNRHRATLRSFGAWCGRADLAAGLERRAETVSPVVPLPAEDLAALFGDNRRALRERTLWCLLHESSAPVTAVLALDVENLDLDDRRARVGGRWVTWRSGTARLLPELIAGRTSGPLFRTDRRLAPGAQGDRCPHTGRGRLSYERAEYLFKQATGHTLRQLRAADR
ncbi:RNA polymerase sigma factor [Paractinoplanes toevensis]|uniref:RNA polymerase sigma factor n=1 Tax=Paractinoplanes toevensis TaxID=571911 RepID=A0A919W773_9ACTN|nr:RNA polymerase sigma factor [Actinoplanes toevensis]GIM88446.1 hypothetical protein Ato02nite_002390 [Actinoplanes toevensis]